MTDKSNGYEGIAITFKNSRGRAVNGIGTPEVLRWAKSLSPGSVVLDLGCGTGVPVSKILVEEGMSVYGVDASPTLVEAFRENFPDRPVVCEAVEDSSFFGRKFDGIIAVGLMFLLPPDAQEALVGKMARALVPGGRMVFTAPPQPIVWLDAMTDQESRSLGAAKYRGLVAAAGLSMIEEFEDAGENHYYNAVR